MRQIDITDAKSGDCKACGGYGSGIFGQPCLACLAPRATYMSFGGGVQSTAIAELVIRRDPRLLAVAPDLPELFIFADTGDEPEAVYAHVEMMRERIEAAGFRWLTVCKGGRLGDTAAAGRVDIPVWTDTDDPDAKRRPMRRAMHCGLGKWSRDGSRGKGALRGQSATEEATSPALWRAGGASRPTRRNARESRKTSGRSFCYPLLSMRWSRLDCLAYLASINMTAPKSACVLLPIPR
jgi:hypothetical protein